MYLLSVIGLMGVLPVLSILIQAVQGAPDLVALVGRWFVFWGVGMRLLIAGIRQIANPAFTASDIFGITDPASHRIIAELGFANVAMGLLGVLSLFNPGWVLPAAVAGGLYYGLAGLKHTANGHRTRNENIAMLSDLAIFLVLGGYAVATLLGR